MSIRRRPEGALDRLAGAGNGNGNGISPSGQRHGQVGLQYVRSERVGEREARQRRSTSQLGLSWSDRDDTVNDEVLREVQKWLASAGQCCLKPPWSCSRGRVTTPSASTISGLLRV
ncbi:hypothetical protein MAHJHV63_16430 [Mycobacterium avium subsp. hominissuis]